MQKLPFFNLHNIKKTVLGILIIFFVMSFMSEAMAIAPELYNREKSYQQFEQINLSNGHLSFTVPVGTLGARGDLSFNPNLSIETFWETQWFSYPDPYPSGGNNNVSYVFPPLFTNSYHTFLGYLTQDYGGGLAQNCNAQYPNAGDVDYSRTHTRITFHAPDGSTIPLKDTLNNGAVLNRQPCTTYRPSRGTVFVGEADSGITFVSDNEIFDPRLSVTNPPAPDPPLTGTLYLKNGTKYRYNGATGVMTVIDKNGNVLTNANTVSGQGYTITDNAGREMKYSSSGDIFDPSTIVYEYKSTGINGHPMTVKVHNDWLHNRLRADYEQRAKYCSAELFPTIGCLGYMGQDEVFDPYVISTIELPNGKEFKFFYNHYGELARVEYPEGGAVEYEHFQVNPLLPGNGISRIVHRAVQEKRVYPNGGTGNDYETKTTYQYSYSNNTETTETVTASNGSFVSKVKHYIYGEPYADFSPNGRFGGAFYPYRYGLETKEYKTEYFGSLNTVSRTTETQWQQADGSSSTTAILNSPRVTQIKTTLNDSGQISKTIFAYDQYVNQTDIYEYDYGTTLPVRHTHTDYVTETDYTSVSGAHLRSLPSATQIYGYQNGQEFLAAQSEIKYDQTSLTPRNNVFGWIDPQRSQRGNPTALRNWQHFVGETNNWIEAKAEYDVLGNVVKTIDAKGYISTIDYSDRFGAADGEARSNSAPSYINAQNVTIYPLNGQSTFAFPTSATNQLGYTSYTQIDYFTGKAVNIEDPNGAISKMIYNDALDRPIQSVTAVGTALEMQSNIVYDDANRRIEFRSDLNALSDNLIKSESFYDGLGRTIESRRYEANGGYIATKSIPFAMVQDPETSIWRVGTKSSNPYRPNAGEQPIWTTALSDSLNRGIKVITPDGAIVKTEYSGNTDTVTDQAGKKRRSVTNALGQIVRVDEPNTAGQLDVSGVPAQPTNYAYNTLNNLTQVEQIGTTTAQCGGSTATCTQTRSFVYDSLSRLKSATNPESGTISYNYDNNGNLIQKTDVRAIVTTYIYDNLNRVTNRNYNAPQNLPNYQTTPNVAYSYDDSSVPFSKGKLTKVTTAATASNQLSETKYTSFDLLGRVLSHQQITDGQTYSSSYVYNLSGALIEETYPLGRVVKNMLDTNGDLAQVESAKTQSGSLKVYANNFTYTAAGAVSSMRLGNGRWESTQFNSRLQSEHISLGTSKNAANQLKLDYEYGALNLGTGQPYAGSNNGNIAKQTITVQSTATVNGFSATQYYAYDSLNRIQIASENLTPNGQATYNSWKQTFTYDRYGNRNFDTANNNTTTIPAGCAVAVCNPQVNPNTNKLVGYEFDSSGNTKVDANNQTFVYDAENKQVQVSNSNGIVGQYFYDGDGKRIKKVVPSTGDTTIFVYDATGKMVAEYSTVVAAQADAKVSYLTSDYLGSPRINTDASGQVIARHDYQPFGEEIQRASYGADLVRKRFTAYERDIETELDFAQARYYNNAQGRFTSVDPALSSGKPVQPQSWNRYGYALNNPLFYTDPTGLIWGYQDSNGVRSFKWFDGDTVGEGFTAYTNSWYVGADTAVYLDPDSSFHREVYGGQIAQVTWSEMQAQSEKGELTNEQVQLLNSEAISQLLNKPEVKQTLALLEHVTNVVGAMEGAQFRTRSAAQSILKSGQNPRAVSTAFDVTTGETFVGSSGGIQPSNIAPVMQQRINLLNSTGGSRTPWCITNCAEFRAVNNALLNGSELHNLVIHTVKTTSGLPDFMRCPNCQVTGAGTIVTSDP